MIEDFLLLIFFGKEKIKRKEWRKSEARKSEVRKEGWNKLSKKLLRENNESRGDYSFEDKWNCPNED